MDLGEFRLARTLQHQAQSERKIDVIRQLLIQEPGFNSYHLFRALANGKDFVSATDLTVFLHENNFVITKPDAQALVARYSKNSTVSYQDFFVNLELPNLSTEPSSPSRGATAPVSHKVLLAHKMKTEVETNRNSSVLKELLAEELGSNFYQAFRQTDAKRSGYLTVDDMARIMGKFSITLTEAELDCLLRKYDSNRDGRVSYLEFLTQLMPEGRVESFKTPYSSPARARIGYSPSPNKSLNASRSSPRDTSRQQLSFDNVADEEDNQLVPFNQSFNNMSMNDRTVRTPTRSPNRSVMRGSPSRAALAVLSPERCIVANCHLPKYGRHYCSLHSNIASPARNPAPDVAAEVSVEIKRELETDFESMRQRLALHPSYTLLNAFKHLDSNNMGYISIQQLRRCLTDAGYYVTPDELELCVRLFDSNGDGRISYAEFISKMMPTEAVYSELVSSPSAGGIRAERRLSIPAQLDLAKALKQRIDQEKQVDQLNRTQMYSWD